MSKAWNNVINEYTNDRFMPKLDAAVYALLRTACDTYKGKQTLMPKVEFIDGILMLSGYSAQGEFIDKAGFCNMRTIPTEGEAIHLEMRLQYTDDRSVLMFMSASLDFYNGRLSKGKAVDRCIMPGEESVEIGILEDDVVQVPEVGFYSSQTAKFKLGFRSEVTDELLRCLKSVEK